MNPVWQTLFPYSVTLFLSHTPALSQILALGTDLVVPGGCLCFPVNFI